MANYHSNLLVVVADNDNMLKVLGAVAANLSARASETGFDGDLHGVGRANEAFGLLQGYMEYDYGYIFTPNPIGSDEWMATHKGSENSELSGIVNALFGVSAEALPDGVACTFAVAPSGRPLSETATVDMKRLGSLYYLAVHYSTAFESNLSDIDEFFEGLPGGEYGFAFLDADEYDGYQQTGVLVGKACGGETLSRVGANTIGADTVLDIFTWARDKCTYDLATEKDLALQAMAYAADFWMGFSDHLEGLHRLEGPDDDDFHQYDKAFGAYCEKKRGELPLAKHSPGFVEVKANGLEVQPKTAGSRRRSGGTGAQKKETSKAGTPKGESRRQDAPKKSSSKGSAARAGRSLAYKYDEATIAVWGGQPKAKPEPKPRPKPKAKRTVAPEVRAAAKAETKKPVLSRQELAKRMRMCSRREDDAARALEEAQRELNSIRREVDEAVAASEVKPMKWVPCVACAIAAYSVSTMNLVLGITSVIVWTGYGLIRLMRLRWAARVRLEGDYKIRRASRQVERLARELAVVQENAAAAKKAYEAKG